MLKLEEDSKNFGHSPAEALFPLFKSDKEYELIEKVISRRFPDVKTEILIMYKYLASKHLPKFVLFSYRLPYGIVIKRLPPIPAWNEEFCSKILSRIHPFNFDVVYHKSLECISERYLSGYDIVELPQNILKNKELVNLIFYWMGKSACVAYVFGLGDRGHNERLHCIESKDLFQFEIYTKEYEPILNIDFEDFPSKRLFNPNLDATEFAMLFFSVILQLSTEFRSDYEDLFNTYFAGFEAKHLEIESLWEKKKRFINESFKNLFRLAPRSESNEMISEINKRASELPEEHVFIRALEMIEKDVAKCDECQKNQTRSIIKEKRRLLYYNNM